MVPRIISCTIILNADVQFNEQETTRSNFDLDLSKYSKKFTTY